MLFSACDQHVASIRIYVAERRRDFVRDEFGISSIVLAERKVRRSFIRAAERAASALTYSVSL